MKQQQLTSRSFTTLEPDQSYDRTPSVRHSQSQPAENTFGQGHLDISVITPDTRLAEGSQAAVSVDQSDEATQTDIFMVGDGSLVQADSYTTSLYIDSMCPTVNVPLQQDMEVMIILEQLPVNSDSQLVISSQQNDSKDERRFVSTVELESSLSLDGCLTLTPTSSRSIECRAGGERSSEVVDRSSCRRQQMSDVGDHRHLDSMVHRSVYNIVSNSMLLFLPACQ